MFVFLTGQPSFRLVRVKSAQQISVMPPRFHATRYYFCSRRLIFELLLIIIILVLLSRLRNDAAEDPDEYGWYTTEIPGSTTEVTTAKVATEERLDQHASRDAKVKSEDVVQKEPTSANEKTSAIIHDKDKTQKETGRSVQTELSKPARNQTEVRQPSGKKTND